MLGGILPRSALAQFSPSASQSSGGRVSQGEILFKGRAILPLRQRQRDRSSFTYSKKLARTGSSGAGLSQAQFA